MKINGCSINPYLPSWEYVPDGEPRIFGNRVYVYGSHDRFRGYAYCLNDYVCYSAPLTDLGDWRYEGVIYKKTDDPKNPDGQMCLYAPDVVQGTDGRYYLYYVLDLLPIVSVAVCDEPAGKYEFLGYCHYEDGTLLGEGTADEAMFDPGVLVENNQVYLYTGFCMPDNDKRHGAMVTILDEDMLTVKAAPNFIVPSKCYGKNTSFEGHEFFEASSIRKVKDKYCFIYSSIAQCELCYATSDSPEGGFKYGGVIVANNDLHIDEYKEAEVPSYYGANNHGSIAEINGQWYIFYHRHTDGTQYSRQGCIEKIVIDEGDKDYHINQVMLTTSGPNGGPLKAEGVWPAYCACNLFCKTVEAYVTPPGQFMDCRFPRITQEGRDGDEQDGFIDNMTDGAVCGFKFFEYRGLKQIAVSTRGYGTGYVEIMTEMDGPVVGKIPVYHTNEWSTTKADVAIEDGIGALYLRFSGTGNLAIKEVELIVTKE